jgi:hypothetical protein
MTDYSHGGTALAPSTVASIQTSAQRTLAQGANSRFFVGLLRRRLAQDQDGRRTDRARRRHERQSAHQSEPNRAASRRVRRCEPAEAFRQRAIRVERRRRSVHWPPRSIFKTLRGIMFKLAARAYAAAERRCARRRRYAASPAAPEASSSSELGSGKLGVKSVAPGVLLKPQAIRVGSKSLPR